MGSGSGQSLSAVAELTNFDNAGYCAIPWGGFSACVASTGTEWDNLGQPDPDPGKSFDTVFPLEVPWSSLLQTAPTLPGSFTNLKIYIPGVEQTGYLNDTTTDTPHMWSYGLEDYIASTGCSNCGPTTGGQANTVDACRPPASVPLSHRYTTAQQKLDVIQANGGLAQLAHMSIDTFENVQLIEIYSNFYDQADTAAGTTARQDAAQAAWDTYNDNAGGGVWGVATNDFFLGPIPEWIGLGGLCAPNCGGANNYGAADLDRGKIEVLLPVVTWADFDAAFRAGAFVAVVEKDTPKGGFPELIGTQMSGTAITLVTTAGVGETVTWITNGGATAGTGYTLDLTAITPNTLTWVRAEIDDGSGKVTFTQPFTLSPVGAVTKATAKQSTGGLSEGQKG